MVVNPPPLPRRVFWLLCVLLLLALGLYWPGLSGGFVFDDFGNLVDNSAFTQIVQHQSFWSAVWASGSGPTDRPISMLSFALQAWFTGLAPWPLKLVNVLIHLANGVLIFVLARAVIGQVFVDRVGCRIPPSRPFSLKGEGVNTVPYLERGSLLEVNTPPPQPVQGRGATRPASPPLKGEWVNTVPLKGEGVDAVPYLEHGSLLGVHTPPPQPSPLKGEGDSSVPYLERGSLLEVNTPPPPPSPLKGEGDSSVPYWERGSLLEVNTPPPPPSPLKGEGVNTVPHLEHGALQPIKQEGVEAGDTVERHLGITPSPPVGEGWGGGVNNLNCSRNSRANPASPTNPQWLISPNVLALLVTAAWLVSPMQLTAVLYVVQRMESLAALFVLAGLWAYWHGRQRQMAGLSGGWPWILGGLIGGTLLATFAKESGVMLPMYAFLLEFFVLRGRGAAGFERRLVPLYALVLFVPGVLGVLWTLPSALNGSAYASRPFDLAERLWTEGRVLFDYLHWLVAPTPNALSLYHDDIPISTGWLAPWTTLTSWLGIAGLLIGAWWLRQRAPLVALGVFWFFAGQALVSTYIPLELVYEHRNYLPSFGVYLALFGLMLTLSPADAERRATLRTLMMAAALGLIALYAGFTALRAHTWGNPFRLAYFEATTHPDSPRANYDLARILMISAPSVSSPNFGIGLQLMDKTIGLPGASIQADQALIFMSAKNHLPISPRWWQDIRHKLDHQPPSAEDVGALFSLVQCGYNGVCHYPAADVAALGETLRAAVARYPRDAGLITLLANYEANITHEFSAAYGLMQQAVALNPKNFSYWQNLVTLQIAAGQLTDAAVGIERMGELNGKGIHDADIAAAKAALAKKVAATEGAGG